MLKKIKALIASSQGEDAALIIRTLENGGYTPDVSRVDGCEPLRAELENGAWDMVFFDHDLPGHSPSCFYSILSDKAAEVSFIIFSDSITEEQAVEAMRHGARDYIRKKSPQRLVPVIEREMRDAEVRREKKRVLEELEKKKESLAKAQEIAKLGSYEFDVETKDMAWSDELRHIFGFKPAGGQSSLETYLGFVHPEDRERVEEQFKKSMDEKSSPHAEYRIIRADGEIRFLYSTSNLEIDAAGRVTAIIGTVEDITDRKLAVEVLNRERNKLTSILNSMQDGVYIVNRKNEIEYINPVIEREFGPVNGRKCHEYFHGRDSTCPWCRNREVFAGNSVRWEWYSPRNDKYYELFDSPIVNSDGSISKFEIFHDITERKLAEEERLRLVTAIEQTGEVVVITDTEARIVYANPAFEKISGYSREEALGHNPRMLKSGKHERKFYEDMWDTISGGKVWSGRFINKRKDGTLYEEEATISPVTDSGGEIVNYVAVKRDITRDSMFSRAKDYFTTVTSHELRTPLTKLKLVEMLLRDIGGEVRDREKFNGIMSSLNECNLEFERVISSITLISELSVPQEKKSLTPNYIYYNLLSSVEHAEKQIEKTGRDVSLTFASEGLPHHTEVMGNQEMMIRAFDEILSNSVKYTLDGKGIHVSARTEPGKVVVDITDEGLGIPQELMDQVFDSYFSIENFLYHSTGKYKYKGGGMGLGLTIARLIMSYHGGELRLHSLGDEKGTTVTFSFPIK